MLTKSVSVRLGAKSELFVRDCDGGATIWNLLLLAGIIGMGGYAVDYSSAVRAEAHLQAVADSAALAGAMDLPSKNRAIATAVAYSGTNASASDYGDVTRAADIRVGSFDVDTGVFTANDTPANAIEVRALRVDARDNSQRTYLWRILGINSLDVGATSMAITSGGDCTSGGLFSNSEVESGSNNDYNDGFCLYGENYVKIGSDNAFGDGTSIMMEDESVFGGYSGGNNSGLDDALESGVRPLELLPLISPVIASMQAGSDQYLPASFKNAPVINLTESELSVLLSGSGFDANTIYIVDGVADLGGNRVIENVAIVATKEIKTASNVTVRNVFFASPDKILFGSNNTFGTVGYCDTGEYNAYAFSNSNIEFGSDTEILGFQLASNQLIKFGSDMVGADGLYAEAAGLISYGSYEDFSGCPGISSSVHNTPRTASQVALVR